jgi:signal transduction histidine kinase
VAFWVGIDADITEIKAIEAALRLSNHELEAFSYSVSHDLRSPLNTVDGFSRLLAKQLGATPGDKVTHYLSRIQAGVAQMGQLIEDLLSLAQVSRAPLSSKTVDLSALARSIMDEWQVARPRSQGCGDHRKGLKAHGDDRLVRVVMENLLGNAWKFSSHERVTEITVGHAQDAAGFPCTSCATTAPALTWPMPTSSSTPSSACMPLGISRHRHRPGHLQPGHQAAWRPAVGRVRARQGRDLFLHPAQNAAMRPMCPDVT